MKKIILYVLLVLIFMGQARAYDITGKFHLTDKINNVYITRTDGINSRNGAIYIIKDSNNNPVYCIEPFQPNLDSSVYEGYYNDYRKFNLSKDVVDKINLYAYYGYGYNNQLDNKWYIITQALIWRTMGLTTNFTSTYHGNQVTMFESEINIIKNNVNNHYIKPSFDNSYKMSINKELIIEDKNNVLDKYEIENTGNLKIKKEDNKLILSSSDEGNYNIKLIKKDKRKTNNKVLYFNSNSQNTFLPGKFDSLEKDITIDIYSAKITINRKGNNNCENATLANSIYEIYDSSNKLYKEIKTNDEGIAIIDNMPIDTYYIKEKESSIGYKKDNNIYKVDFNYELLEKNIDIELENDSSICPIKEEKNNYVNDEYIIEIPNTLSNSISILSIISSLFIIVGLGIIVLYAKKN